MKTSVTGTVGLTSRIKSLEAIPIKMPLKKVFKGSNYYMAHRCTIVTRLTTEDGVIGEIYNGDELEDLEVIVQVIQHKIAPLVIGENVFAAEYIWNKMFPLTFDILGNRKVALNAISCVDSAIYDAVGKLLNMPLVRLWGGFKKELPVMLIGGYYTEGKAIDKHRIIADIQEYQEMGVAACKFKVGGRPPEADIERVRIAREAAGDQFVIAVDANQGWERREALQFAQGVKEYNIRWFEEPCRWSYDMDGMKDIRYMTGIPVAAGQSEDAAGKCIELMTRGSIDVCNFDASWSGGPTAWRRVASAAEALGFEMAHHEEAQVSAHLLGSIKSGTFLEIFHSDRDPLFYEIIENRNSFQSGYYKIPDGPGFGIVLNQDVIKHYRVDI